MRFTLERVTQPEFEPVTLAEMKRHLRAYDDITTDDDDITALIKAAREWVEDYTGRTLIDTTWRLTLGDYVPTDTTGMIIGELPLSTQGIPLRRSPVIAIVSVATVDADNVETVVDSADYQLREADSKWPVIVGLVAATTTRIVFRAGFADRVASPGQGAEVVPVRFLQAMKLWVEANYYRDEKMMLPLLDVAERLIKPERAHLQIA
jgi:uncharacterized phiE125 gp8 family phage protein